MNTNNIISTPAITGNIGICKTEKQTVQITGGMWSTTQLDYLTNSCTGEVAEYPEYWSPGFGTITLFIASVVMLVLVIIIAIIRHSINN